MEQFLNDLPQHLIAWSKIIGIFAFGCSFMWALIVWYDYIRTIPKTPKLLKLQDRTDYPLGTIGKYHGNKVVIQKANFDQYGEQSCDGCIALPRDGVGCKAHHFMCDTLVREDGENIILKEVQ